MEIQILALHLFIAQGVGSGVSCDKLFGRADRVLKHLALAPGSYADAVDHTKPCKGRGEATTTRNVFLNRKGQAVDSSQIVSSNESNFFQQLTVLAA
jgi:hypothetical protein